DLVDVLQGVKNGGLITDVADHQLYVGCQFYGSFALGVDLLDQAVEHPNPIAALKQGLGQVAADEPGAAGDENGFRHGELPVHELEEAAGGAARRLVLLKKRKVIVVENLEERVPGDLLEALVRLLEVEAENPA